MSGGGKLELAANSTTVVARATSPPMRSKSFRRTPEAAVSIHGAASTLTKQLNFLSEFSSTHPWALRLLRTSSSVIALVIASGRDSHTTSGRVPLAATPTAPATAAAETEAALAQREVGIPRGCSADFSFPRPRSPTAVAAGAAYALRQSLAGGKRNRPEERQRAKC
eukprot:CAMPEP_0115146436 /NCGR_PEP_ID=MMETSP0227-20121206/62701_1 /TAXON_ID=89957 /ORGANISM="Polarella glacialis, Strain CCMP 1383" /LENGTH=166 /DNA_ID=CAMNT_0002556127 /DNA_START=8 /DNA_END=509 /DNA_ORIENTATION=-